VKDNGNLAGNGDLRLLHADPLCEFDSPALNQTILRSIR
jgi:hypothetical protein